MRRAAGLLWSRLYEMEIDGSKDFVLIPGLDLLNHARDCPLALQRFPRRVVHPMSRQLLGS